MADEQQLTYEEVIEYLADRKGDLVTMGSYPCYHRSFAVVGADEDGHPILHPVDSDSPTTMLGLECTGELGQVTGRRPFEEREWSDGRAAVLIPLLTGNGDGFVDVGHSGLTITREWFRAAALEAGNATLRIIVAANSGAGPFFSPVGQERNETIIVTPWDEVGWGFSFDFDGDPPFEGRWSRSGERWNAWAEDEDRDEPGALTDGDDEEA